MKKAFFGMFGGRKQQQQQKDPQEQQPVAAWPNDVPNAVWRLFDLTQQLFQACRKESTDYESPVLELHMWDYNYCPNDGIAWPAHWPTAQVEPPQQLTPALPRVFQQKGKPFMCVETPSSVHGRAFSVFLPTSENNEVTRIIERLRREDRMCVVFEQVKYAAIKRVPLPGESHWLRKDCASSHLPADVLPQTPPVLVLRMPDPWAMSMGAEAPALVVYADGLAIFSGAKEMTLKTGAFAPWDALLAVLKEIAPSNSSLSAWTDQTSYNWTFWGVPGDESTKKVVSVYGDMQGYVDERGPIPQNILNNAAD